MVASALIEESLDAFLRSHFCHEIDVDIYIVLLFFSSQTLLQQHGMGVNTTVERNGLQFIVARENIHVPGEICL